jgi:hypothetical protein
MSMKTIVKYFQRQERYSHVLRLRTHSHHTRTLGKTQLAGVLLQYLVNDVSDSG